MRKATAVFALALGTALLLSGCSNPGAPSGGADDDPIVFGAHTTLTGPLAYVGAGYSMGVELAAKEINANGGIDGHPLEIKIVDDKGTPEGGTTAARELVERDNVLLVMSGGVSSATIPNVPYFKSNGVVYMVSVASDPRISEELVSNVFVGAPVTTAVAVPHYADYIQNELDAKTVAMIVCDGGFCTSAAPLLQAELDDRGIEVVQTATFNSGDTDFTGQVQAIDGSDPDVVFILGSAADDGRIIPQLRRGGVDVPLVGDITAAESTLVEAAGPAAEGLTAFWIGASQFLADDTGVMGDWLASVEENMPDRPTGTPSLHSLMGYADVYVLAEAIRAAGGDLSSEAIAKSLETNIKDFVAGADENWTFAEPIALPRTFTPEDHRGNSTLTPLRVEDGKFVPVG